MVSIIIPSYNAKDYIVDSVRSAIEQDVSREIIIIDDKSKDGCIDLTYNFIKDNYDISVFEIDDEAYVRRFSNFKLLHCFKINQRKFNFAEQIPECAVYIISNTKNRGAAYSRNKGVRIARGEYVAFLDSDDWWEKGKLKKQLDLLEKTGSSLCTTDRELVLSDDKLSGVVIESPATITFRKLLKSNWINCSAVLVKREAMMGFTMKPGKLHEDYLCWLNVVRDYGPAVNINEPLLKYRVRFKSKSGNKFRSMILDYNTYRSFGYRPVRSALLTVRNLSYGVRKFAVSMIRAKKMED